MSLNIGLGFNIGGAIGTRTNTADPYLEVKIEGARMDRDVKSIMVEDHDRLIDKAVIEAWDQPRVCTDFVRENQKVTIELGWASSHAVIFEGIVRSVRGETDPGERRLVTITAFDLSYQMLRRAPRTVDHTGTLSSIVTAIVRQYQGDGIHVGTISPDPDPTFTANRPLRQTNKTDWQFIQDLTLAYGGRAFVEYNDGQSKFYFISQDTLVDGDALGSLKMCRGYSHLKRFRFSRIAAGTNLGRVAATIDPDTGDVQQTPTPPPTLPDAPTTPDTNQIARLSREMGSSHVARYSAAAQLAVTGGNPATLRRPANAAGLPSNPTVLAALARPDPTRILGLRGEGIANGNIMIRAKGKIEVEGIAAWAAGDWYVKKVQHKVQGRAYESHFVVTR